MVVPPVPDCRSDGCKNPDVPGPAPAPLSDSPKAAHAALDPGSRSAKQRGAPLPRTIGRHRTSAAPLRWPHYALAWNFERGSYSGVRIAQCAIAPILVYGPTPRTLLEKIIAAEKRRGLCRQNTI